MKLVDKVREYLDDKCSTLSTGFYTDTLCRMEEWEELGQSIESPIEQLFYIEWQFKKIFGNNLLLELEPQYQDESMGKYRLDFNIDFIQEAVLLGDGREWNKTVEEVEAPKLGIELDGYMWHEKTKEQAQYHKERERFLVANGWKLLRFTGSEVYKDPEKCVNEVLKIAFQLRKKYHKEVEKNFEGRGGNG